MPVLVSMRFINLAWIGFIVSSAAESNLKPTLFISGQEDQRGIVRYLSGDPTETWIADLINGARLDYHGLEIATPKTTSSRVESTLYYPQTRGRSRAFDVQCLNFSDFADVNRCQESYDIGLPGEVSGLSFDWLAKNMYWLDGAYNWIRMAGINPNVNRLVVEQGLRNPTTIAVHPRRSFLFWGDDGMGVIERASLSGDARQVLRRNQQPVSMVVDYAEDKIYWNDRSRSIHSCDVNGLGCITHLEDTQEYFAIAVYQDFLFAVISKSTGSSLYIYNKTSNSEISNFRHATTNKVFDMEMFSYDTGVINYPCDSAGCKHLCVGADDNTDAMCLCADLYSLANDSVSCEADATMPVAPFYLVVINDTLRYIPIPLQPTDSRDMKLGTGINWGEIYAVDVNAEREVLYLAHGQPKRISSYRAPWQGVDSSATIFLGHEELDIKGIGVDWTSDNIYWSEARFGFIMMTSVLTERTVAIHTNLTEPGGLAVDYITRKIYWVEGRSAIRRSNFDGSNIDIVVEGGEIGAFFLDVPGRRIYWADTEVYTMHAIKEVNLDKSGARTLVVVHRDVPLSITVFQDFVAWTKRMPDSTYAITWVVRDDAQTVHQELHRADPASHIRAFSSYGLPPPDAPGPCDSADRCDQVCIALSATERECRCSLGLKLVDETRCVPQDILDNNFLLVSDSIQGELYQIALYETTARVLPTNVSIQASHSVYDHANRTLYWTEEGSLDQLFYVPIDQQDATPGILDLSTGTIVGGLAYDTEKYEIYYTNKANQAIHVVRGGDILTLISALQGVPHGIALDCNKRIMYWAETSSSIALGTLLSAPMDEFNLRATPIIQDRILNPTVLVLDPSGEELFWYDATLGTVDSASISGGNRRLLLQRPCSGLAVDGNYVFVIGHDLSSSVMIIDRQDNKTHMIGSADFFDLSSIQVIQMGPLPAKIDPSPNNSLRNMIIGASIGCVLGLLVIVIVIVAVCKRPRLKRLKRESMSLNNSYLRTLPHQPLGIETKPPTPPPIRVAKPPTDNDEYDTIQEGGGRGTLPPVPTAGGSDLYDDRVMHGVCEGYRGRDPDAYEQSAYIRGLESEAYERPTNIGGRDSEAYERPTDIGGRDSEAFERPTNIGGRDSEAYERPTNIGGRESEAYEWPTNIGGRESEAYARMSDVHIGSQHQPAVAQPSAADIARP